MIQFSVLVPVYNVEKYVADCIKSVLCQTYKDFELILIDDGSKDDSGNICDRFAEVDSRIKVFHKENKGLMHTRRYAIDKASGDYYVFLDSDDMLKSNALQKIYEAINRYDCDCVIYGLERINEGKVVGQSCSVENVCLTRKNEIYKKCLFDTSVNCLCRKAVRADVFQGFDFSPFYHIRMGEDLLQSLEIYKNSRSIAFINDILYEYRMNPTSITHTYANTDIDLTVRKTTLRFLQLEQVFNEEELNKYRDFCINIFIDVLYKTALLDTDYKGKKKILEELRQDSYYQNFLKKGITDRKTIGVRSVIFDLYRHKKDCLMLSVIGFEKKIREKTNEK